MGHAYCTKKIALAQLISRLISTDTEWSWTVSGRKEARDKMQQLLREHGKK
jgi:hypothetical protein